MPAEPDGDAVARDAEALIARWRERGWTLATCESLTGGLLGSTLTGIPGASRVYRGGFITYATDLKGTLVGVDAETLADFGAVSAQTAEAMARGARVRCTAEWAVSLTGVAGPEPQEGKPVGTVWIGLAGPAQASAQLMPIDAVTVGRGRGAIRQAAVGWAIRYPLELD